MEGLCRLPGFCALEMSHPRPSVALKTCQVQASRSGAAQSNPGAKCVVKNECIEIYIDLRQESRILTLFIES